jgi:hypothetical protein
VQTACARGIETEENGMSNKVYLGDSVYAELECGMIKLTTWNGYDDDPRNVIYLESEVLEAFELYLKTLRAKQNG